MGEELVFQLVFLRITPPDMIRASPVSRFWNFWLKSDVLWRVHMNRVLSLLPSLGSFFSQGEPIWRVFCKRLWLKWKGCHTQVAHYPNCIKEAIIRAGHSRPERIESIL